MNETDNRSQKIRLKDVAENAGVSPTTASMVFTDTGRISSETTDRVLKSAKSMGYVHQPREKRTTRKGRNVGLLMLSDPEWSFIWHFLTGMINQIKQELGQTGINLIIIPVSHHEDDEVIYQKIMSTECQSVFSVHLGKAILFQRLESEGIPVIVIMNSNYQDTYYSICVDDFAGACEGTLHLLSLGHRRIDYVDTIREDLPALTTDRYFGYRKALEESEIPFRKEHRITCDPDISEEELESRFLDSLNGPEPPTAIFCLDDEIAFRVWNALTRLGYSIPEDISILAPGDVLDYSKPYVPQITTMHIDTANIGKLAGEMLINRLNRVSDTVHVFKVRQQLVERGSCRPL